MADRQPSALERRQTAGDGEPFPNVEIFYGLVGAILKDLHRNHPVPHHIDRHYYFGSVVTQDAQLSDIFRWTEDFLRAEKIIREIEPIEQGGPMRYVLTMLGLKLLASPTSELQAAESVPDGTLADTLKAHAAGMSDEATKSIVRAAVGGALTFFARHMM